MPWNIVVPMMETEILFCTNVMPEGDKGFKGLGSFKGVSPSMLKSLLQKHIRLGNVEAAGRVFSCHLTQLK
jgi:hypothetical protein